MYCGTRLMFWLKMNEHVYVSYACVCSSSFIILMDFHQMYTKSFISTNIPVSPAYRRHGYSRVCAQCRDDAKHTRCTWVQVLHTKKQILRASSRTDWLLRNINISNSNRYITHYFSVSLTRLNRIWLYE